MWTFSKCLPKGVSLARRGCERGEVLGVIREVMLVVMSCWVVIAMSVLRFRKSHECVEVVLSCVLCF